MLSQNVLFVGAVAEKDDDTWPPGEPLARLVHEGLAARGWKVEEPGSWGDSGWEIACGSEAKLLTLVFVEGSGDDEWVGQLFAPHRAGFIERFFFKKETERYANDADMFALACDVHEVLEAGGFSKFRWRWDWVPEDDSPGRPPPPP